jgi:ATP-dependent DNA ligase
MNIGFDKTKFKTKTGKYLIGPAVALKDLTLHAKAQDYKRRISALMTPLEPSRISEKIPNLDGYLVSRKVDGEFCLLFFDGKTVISVNPGGTVRAGLPAFAELAKHLKDAKIKSASFAGELHFKTEKRERVHDVLRIARNPKKQADLNNLMIALFDIVSIDDETIRDGRSVFSKLDEIVQKGNLVNVVEHLETGSRKEIESKYREWTEVGGSEGLVVRNEQVGWFKIKPVHTIDCVVLGFSDSANDRKGMLHDLLVGLVRDDGSLQTMARVGGGFTDEERLKLLKKLKKMVVPSDYIEVSSAHVAYEMVKPDLVIEMKFLDLISEKGRGGPINRMVLSYNDGEYSAVRRMPFVSIIAPRFKRLRDDKEPTKDDAPVGQVADLVSVDDIKKKVADLDPPKSEVLKREVFTKTVGVKTMVRKLLIWKTNKKITGEFPAYVVYYTDFSTGRKQPMANELIPANTKNEAESKYGALRKKIFLTGWEQVQ